MNREIRGNNANSSPRHDNRGNDGKGCKSIQFISTTGGPGVLYAVQGVDETEHVARNLKKKSVNK